MRINENLNLVVPVERAPGDTIYIHSTPISFEVWQRYYLVLSKTFAAFFQQGLREVSGPAVAAMLLRDIAKGTPRPDMPPGTSWWEGPDGVEQGLLAEFTRLSNVITPGPNGWTATPLAMAFDKNWFDEETREEALSLITFFMVASRAAPKNDRRTLIDGEVRIYDLQTTSLDSTAYARSLRTSTTEGTTAPKPNGGGAPPPQPQAPHTTDPVAVAAARLSQPHSAG